MSKQEKITMGTIIEYDDNIKAVVMDMCNDELYIFNENACIETINIHNVKNTGKNIDLNDILTQLRKNETSNEKFTWTDKEDDELYKHGLTITWAAGRSKAIQKFVEALSYKIGYKCDFSFTAGRAHIDVSKEGYNKAIEVLNDESFMKSFIVPYSTETYDNETYFEILK